MGTPTLNTIEKIIQAKRQEIIDNEDWFFNFEEHTLNVYQAKDGVFKVVLYEAPGNSTNFSSYRNLTSLNFEA